MTKDELIAKYDFIDVVDEGLDSLYTDFLNGHNTDQESILVQIVNCEGDVNGPLAKHIAAKYPHVKTAYKEFCKQATDGQDLLGQCQIVPADPNDPNNKQFIANIFGVYSNQKSSKLDLDAVWCGLQTVSAYVQMRYNRDKRAKPSYYCDLWPIIIPYGLGYDMTEKEWLDTLGMLKDCYEWFLYDTTYPFLIYTNEDDAK